MFAIKKTYTIFDTIAALAQDIILQVQELEASKQLLDKVANLHGTRIITQSDGVDGQARLQIKLVQGQKLGIKRQTSSSTMAINARRYSSIVKWKASFSFRLTGTR